MTLAAIYDVDVDELGVLLKSERICHNHHIYECTSLFWHH